MILLVCLLGCLRGNAGIFHDPPNWWEPLEQSRQGKLPLDINQDGVVDLEFGFYQSFHGFVQCCRADVDLYWQVIPKGDSKVLVTSGTVASTPVLRLAAREQITAANSPGKVWAGGSRELGRLVVGYENFPGPSAVVDGSGPFADNSGFVGVRFETVEGTAVGWVSVPKLVEEFSAWLTKSSTNSAPVTGFKLADGTPLSAGEPGGFPQPGTRRLAPADVDGDGVIDYWIEQRWGPDWDGQSQLLQVAVKGQRGSRILATTGSDGLLPKYRNYDVDGQPTGREIESPQVAKLRQRELIEPQAKPDLRWTESDQWLVLWQHDPDRGPIGPLAGGEVLFGGKTSGQRCGWLRLVDPIGKLSWGGFADFDAMVGETKNDGSISSRLDLNGDGLVDIYHYSPSIPLHPQCGLLSALRLEEPGLVFRDFNNSSATNVAAGTVIPAERYLFEPTAGDSSRSGVGSLTLHHTVCQPDSWGGAYVSYEYSITTNFVPLRVMSVDGWHAGWIGYLNGRLRTAVHPVAGEPIAAGAIGSPWDSVKFRIQTEGDDLIFSWGNRLTAPKVLRRRSLGTVWEAVPAYDSWSTGLRVRIAPSDTTWFFRLDY